MYDKLKWLTVLQLVVYHTLLCVYRIRKEREPEYLASILYNDGIRGNKRHWHHFCDVEPELLINKTCNTQQFETKHIFDFKQWRSVVRTLLCFTSKLRNRKVKTAESLRRKTTRAPLTSALYILFVSLFFLFIK